MSAPDIPTEYTMHTHVDGSMMMDTKMTGDPNNPLATLMIGDPNKPLSTLMIGDRNKPLSMLMIGDPKQPIATTMQMEMLNLPRFSLNDLKDLMTPKIRMRMPNYSQVCFKLLGQEIFSVCMSGESQMITEPYVPNSRERCEVTCCEPDTRPFPGDNPDEPGNNPRG